MHSFPIQNTQIIFTEKMYQLTKENAYLTKINNLKVNMLCS